jgi:hypothetical protein
MMRAALAWEGFRSRWSSLESRAVGIEDVSGVAQPVVVIGYDGPDASGVNFYGQRNTVAGGLFGHTRLTALVPIWVTGFRAWDLAAGAQIFSKASPWEPPPFGAAAGQIVLGPAVPALQVLYVNDLNPPTFLEALIPKDEWVALQAPGLLIGPPGFSHGTPLGQRLDFSCDTAGEDYSIAVHFRSA